MLIAVVRYQRHLVLCGDLMSSILEMHCSGEGRLLGRLQTTMINEIRIVVMLLHRLYSCIVVHRRGVVVAADDLGYRGGL